MSVKLDDSLTPDNLFRHAPEEQLHQQQVEFRRRSRARLGISGDDVARMVKAFAASHGGIAMGPPAYAAISNQYNVPQALHSTGY